jgi:hypothetical protein
LEDKKMGLAKLNIWVSEVADPCGTWSGTGAMTILDCKGILAWPCGRYLNPDGKWQAVPNGNYRNLPFRCGHLEVELPPGCYWVIAGNITPIGGYIHLNYTTHVGIVEVGCNQDACVKLFNPSVRLCWNWFNAGLRVLAANKKTGIDAKQVEAVQRAVETLLKDAPRLPIEQVIDDEFKALNQR